MASDIVRDVSDGSQHVLDVGKCGVLAHQKIGIMSCSAFSRRSGESAATKTKSWRLYGHTTTPRAAPLCSRSRCCRLLPYCHDAAAVSPTVVESPTRRALGTGSACDW